MFRRSSCVLDETAWKRSLQAHSDAEASTWARSLSTQRQLRRADVGARRTSVLPTVDLLRFEFKRADRGAAKSLHGTAAVDQHSMTGDKRSLVGGQPQHRRCNLVGLAEASDWMPCPQRLLEFGRVD